MHINKWFSYFKDSGVFSAIEDRNKGISDDAESDSSVTDDEIVDDDTNDEVEDGSDDGNEDNIDVVVDDDDDDDDDDYVIIPKGKGHTLMTNIAGIWIKQKKGY